VKIEEVFSTECAPPSVLALSDAKTIPSFTLMSKAMVMRRYSHTVRLDSAHGATEFGLFGIARNDIWSPLAATARAQGRVSHYSASAGP
jgi:hypothetical protein